MPFVLFLFFGIWFLAICVKRDRNARFHINNFPSCRYQEEYLLFCEKFLEYSADSTHKDPMGDALEDARYEIWKAGHLPSTFTSYGMNEWACRPITRRLPFPNTSSRLHLMPVYGELHRFRNKDKGWGVHSMRDEFLEHHGKDVVFNEERWEQYCEEIDKRFEAIWLKQQPLYSYEQLPWISDYFDISSIIISRDAYIVYDSKTDRRLIYFGGRVLGRIHQDLWNDTGFSTVKSNMRRVFIGDLVYMQDHRSLEGCCAPYINDKILRIDNDIGLVPIKLKDKLNLWPDPCDFVQQYHINARSAEEQTSI